MKLIKLAAASLNQTPLDWQQNQNHILEAIQQAQQQQIDILCLPELCISGYGCEDMFLSIGVQQQALQSLIQIIPHTQKLIVALGLPILHQNRVYNCVALIVNGQIQGFSVKRFLANDGIHYESRWFHPWQAGTQSQLNIEGKNYPIGDLMFNCAGINIGFEICEDAWVNDRPARYFAQLGVDIILNPTASHFAFNKRIIRQNLVCESSRVFNCSYIYANLLGNEAGRIIYDGETIIASSGELQAIGQRLSFADSQLISTVIDIDKQRIKPNCAYKNDQSIQIIDCDFNYQQHQPIFIPANHAAWEHSEDLKNEEFTRAVALGLYDYLRKSYANGFVISLSGGADSGTLASLIYYMMQLGTQELGLQKFCAKLPESLRVDNINALMPKLLACVYQSTKNSSVTTATAAKTLAHRLRCTYYHWSIDDQVEGYTALVEQQIQRSLNWENDDIALQNIQARSRSPAVWMLSNVRQALLLATSNRSEIAVGYATMDGDTSGGLSPIAGVDKTFIRAWLIWAATKAPLGLTALTELKLINQQQPTAELRPGETQTDETDLMPYDILNQIEQAAIRDKQTPIEVLQCLHSSYPQYSTTQLKIWISLFFKLWAANQWKRERYAPSFHLDDRNLDPKTWCRFPILSGGFKQELQQLKAYQTT